MIQKIWRPKKHIKNGTDGVDVTIVSHVDDALKKEERNKLF